jgi:HSP20 family molecular chaperone IbpA
MYNTFSYFARVSSGLEQLVNDMADFSNSAWTSETPFENTLWTNWLDTDGNIVATIDIPGVKKEDVIFQYKPNGETKFYFIDIQWKRDGVSHQRSYVIDGSKFDVPKTSVKLQDGVLTITFLKIALSTNTPVTDAIKVEIQ